MLGGSLLVPFFVKRFTTGQVAIIDTAVIFLGATGAILAPMLELKLFFIGLECLILPCGNVVYTGLGLGLRLIPHELLGRFNTFGILLAYGIAIPVQFMLGILYDSLGFTNAALIYLVLLGISSLPVLHSAIRTIPHDSELDAFVKENRVQLS